MKHYVYLSGPIAGLTYDESEDWRIRARALLEAKDCAVRAHVGG